MGRILAGTVLAFALALVALPGCARQGAPAPDAVAAPVAANPAPSVSDVAPVVADVPAASDKSEPGVVDYSCTTDADCAIKDVGNCCGSYPVCVNGDSPTFPEQVKAQCAESDMSSACGFPVLSGCQCVENRCQGVNAADGAPGGRVD